MKKRIRRKRNRLKNLISFNQLSNTLRKLLIQNLYIFDSELLNKSLKEEFRNKLCEIVTDFVCLKKKN